MDVPSGFLGDVGAVLGERGVLTDPEVTRSYAVDWTGRLRADPPVVVRPRLVSEVVAIVGAARAHGVALVAQGGNTGLVGGATPLDGEVVVDLRGFVELDRPDALAGQITVGAGVSIAAVQAAAHTAGWAYGVDWAARDTATVGGSIATDAGGLRFVRHGGTRRQLLGIQAVLGDGTVIDHRPSVEKDNTGYDLAGLLCGSEGTLGFVTAARLRLVAPPGPCATALIGFASLDAAVQAASLLRRAVSGVQAVELMVAAGLEFVRNVTGLPAPLATPSPVYLLVEVDAEGEPEQRLARLITEFGGVDDAVVASDAPRAAQLWRYREEHTAAINTLGSPHKFDVTLPADRLASFVAEAPALVAGVCPQATTWLFGHAADGNIHVNVTGLSAADEAVAEVVLTEVAQRGGSISAEHGIGRAKRRWMHLARGAGDLVAMAAVKRALDPDGVCNPNVLLPVSTRHPG